MAEKFKKQDPDLELEQDENNAPPPGPGPGGRGGYQKPKDLKKTILRIASYIARRPLMLMLALLFVVLSSISGVAGTYMMRPIINSITAAANAGQTDIPGLLRSVLTLMAVYILAGACIYGQSNLMAQLAQKGCNALRKDLFNKLQDLPLAYFDRHTHGELMSRFTNDADNVQMALEQSVVQLLSSAITFVATVSMMLYISRLLFVVTVVVLIAVLLCFKFLGGASRRYYKEQQTALGRVNGNIQENIEGLKVVKAFTHEEKAKTDFRKLNEDYRVAASTAGFYSASIMPVAGQTTNIGYALTAALGGFIAITAPFGLAVDIGGLVTFLTYTKQVAQPVNQISMQMTTLLSALAGAERIFEVMDQQPEQDVGLATLEQVRVEPDGSLTLCEGGERTHHWAWKYHQDERSHLVHGYVAEDGTAVRDDSAPGYIWQHRSPNGKEEFLVGLHGQIEGDGANAYELIELKGDVRLTHVDFSYVPGKQVLKDVTVYAKPGQKIAFVGSTGAGKTTITNLINRFYDISGGMITYDGIDIRHIQKDSLRRSLGIVLQDTHLFTGTVMDNIRYGRLDATDEECVEAAKIANAHSFIRRLPDGYQTVITGDGANLSQGQRQLLAIARAAVADPPVMVLDEATSSIDTRTEALISKGMDALMEGRTVFVIAHRLSTVRNSDAIAVIEGGEIIEKGSHAQLLEQKGRYYKLYTGQFQLT